GGLRAEDAIGRLVDDAEPAELAPGLVDLRQQGAGRDRYDDLRRQPPAELLRHLVTERLRPLRVERPDVDVDERPRLLTGDLRAQAVDVVVVAFDRDERPAVDRRRDDLAGLEV